MTKRWRIGVDVGGTFTDFTVFEKNTGQLINYKTPSTPNEPAQAVENGLKTLINDYGIEPQDIGYLGHGTTVALNMLLERRAKPIGLLTTKGFRDVLEIGRQTRPHLYDYRLTRPKPLALRSHRIEIPERVDVDGNIIEPLNIQSIEQAALRFLKDDIDAIAICFIHSYKYPNHEVKAAAVLKDKLPNAFISISSDVLPEFREYERTSTTAVNTYVGPRMQLYLQQIKNRIDRMGIKCAPYIIHSNGGLLTIPTATKYPVKTCLSGPAAGVVGATAIAKRAKHNNFIAFDVGGTSTDVSLVLDGKPFFTLERNVGGFPIKSPSIDVHAIGAGGGSIAWIDDGGALRVGPNSAGADPGPVAYNNGGTEVTLTDANLILGRLDSTTLLSGKIPLNVKLAKKYIEEKITKPLSLSIEEAALGIIKVSASGISRAIRSVASTKGLNPLDFSLFAYGGAGPLLGAVVNEEVGSQTIIIPSNPGTICAQGILLSDRTFDFSQTILVTLEHRGWELTLAAFQKLTARAERWFKSEKISNKSQRIIYYIDARYLGQSFEVQVEPFTASKKLTLLEFATIFNKEHKIQYGYDIPDRMIEIVTCRATAIEQTNKPLMQKQSTRKKQTKAKHRLVYCDSNLRWQKAIVCNREQLLANKSFQGPAIIEEMSSTTFVPPNYSVSIDANSNIIMELIQ
ncbi:MAG: hydantoinase/oxoprolinase family protein [Rhodospirillaceae bacterium]|nr:hydantoinase/oxoprolinase family protein [Rhodospirillaceae bacterium]